jgi:hypothetical protein
MGIIRIMPRHFGLDPKNSGRLKKLIPKQAYPAAEEASPAAVGKLFSEQM